MTNIPNFDNFLFHCSALGYIMTDPKEKSNREKYDEALDKLEPLKAKFYKLQEEYEGVKNKETQTAERKYNTMINAGSKLYDLENLIRALEPIKDDVQLSQTCRSYLMDLFVQERYGRVKDIQAKMLEKGNILEEDAITVYSRLTKQYHEKHKIRVNDEFVTGEIDFPSKDFIVINDTKVAWDIFSFWANLARPLDNIYYWQAQGYMRIWGEVERVKIIKTLLDTPQKLIEKEKKNLLYEFLGTEEQYDEACGLIEKKHKYSDIPVEERVIEFIVERNDADIDRIPERAIQCRQFLNSIRPGTYYENNTTYEETGSVS